MSYIRRSFAWALVLVAVASLLAIMWSQAHTEWAYLEIGNVRYKVLKKDRAILEAVLSKDTLSIEHLARSGADINAKFYFDNVHWIWETPIHLAAKRGDSRAVRTLLDAGADPDSVDYHGFTALMQMARERYRVGFEECARYLVDAGANLDRQGYPERLNPLTLCVLNTNIPYARTVLTLGANVNSQDSKGSTALHVACRMWSPSEAMIGFLIENGADPTIRNQAGQTALDLLPENLRPSFRSSREFSVHCP